MNKIKLYAGMVIALSLIWVAYTVATDTTFSWSGPNQNGTLTYTDLKLVRPVIVGGSANSFTNSGVVSSTNAVLTTPTLVGAVTAVSANQATTNIIVTSAGVLDITKIASPGVSCVCTGVVWNGGASTTTWTFVNGILTARVAP